jgi:hypothetical protein
LNETLQESINLFNLAIKKVNKVSKELQIVSIDLDENAVILEEESKKIKIRNTALGEVVEDLQTETTLILSHQEKIVTAFADLGAQVQKCDRAIGQSLSGVESLGEVASCFSEAAQRMKKGHEKFSHSVDRFCLFVESKTHPVPGHATILVDYNSKPDEDNFLNYLIEQNNEDERFLVHLGVK